MNLVNVRNYLKCVTKILNKLNDKTSSRSVNSAGICLAFFIYIYNSKCNVLSANKGANRSNTCNDKHRRSMSQSYVDLYAWVHLHHNIHIVGHS